MMEPTALHTIRSRSDAARPPDVVQDGGDLYWYRTITVAKPDGPVSVRRRVCEDCWRSMPLYVHSPGGFVSPESDTEIPGRKTRVQTLGTRASDGTALTGIETVPRCVCRACYLAAFHRVYGQEPPQPVPDDVYPDGAWSSMPPERVESAQVKGDV